MNSGEDYEDDPIHVSCDDECGALRDPKTPEEVWAAYEHWRSHEYLFGCSHAR